MPVHSRCLRLETLAFRGDRLSRLKRKEEADRELATFKELDEARKARSRSDGEIDDEDIQNPPAPPI